MKSLALLSVCSLLSMGAFANETFFQSPSGNIYCEGRDSSVGCFIMETNKGHQAVLMSSMLMMRKHEKSVPLMAVLWMVGLSKR